MLVDQIDDWIGALGPTDSEGGMGERERELYWAGIWALERPIWNPESIYLETNSASSPSEVEFMGKAMERGSCFPLLLFFFLVLQFSQSVSSSA